MTVGMFEELDVLENAIIAFREGASDEKRMAITSLENLLNQKLVEVEAYDAWVEEQSLIYLDGIGEGMVR